MSDLKPCPFCGHPPVLQQKLNDGRWLTDCNTVTCIRPTTGFCKTKGEAITAWNTRQPDQAAMIEGARLMRDAALFAVRGTNGDLCKSAEASYRIALEAILALDPVSVVGGGQ